MQWQLFKLSTGNIPGIVTTILKHPVAFAVAIKEARKRAKEIVPKRHGLPYDIPVYRQDMPYCKSKEKYLRPTYLCESNAPEIIAMANKLGAFQKSDREYVESCFNFVKRNIEFTFFQQLSGALKTLRAGRGICLDQVSCFIALCRAGGIPARYKIYNEALVTPVYQVFTANSVLVKDWYDSTGHALMHTSAEAFVNGQWMVGEFIWPPELEAGLGVPLSRFGDDASGTWCYRLRESTVRLEALPRGFVIGMRLGMGSIGWALMAAEIGFQEKLREGKKILEEIGEEEYSRRVSQTYKAILPEVSKKLSRALEMVDEL